MRLFPHQVYLETDRPEFPPVCMCCLGPAQAVYSPTPPPRGGGQPDPLLEPLEFPYCSACLAHLRQAQESSTRNLIAGNLLIWGMAVPFMAGMSPALMAAGPISAGVYLAAQKRGEAGMKENCAHSGAACRVVWHRRNTYLFTFASEKYAQMFSDANAAVISKEP